MFLLGKVFKGFHSYPDNHGGLADVIDPCF